MARDEKHAEQIRAWKQAHPQRVRMHQRRWRENQKKRRAEALRVARKEAQEETK